jgi:hypothetical protein
MKALFAIANRYRVRNSPSISHMKRISRSGIVDRPVRFGSYLHSMAWMVVMLLSLGARAADLPSAPEFSVPGGVYTNDVVLKLSAKEPGAAVHFTLDGSEPTTASARYAAPISLTNSTMVRARVFAPGKPPGAPAVQSFVLLDPDVIDFTSDLPVVVVSSFGREIEKDDRIVASLRTMAPANGRTSLQSAADFDGRALINLRGRASLRYPKRSYTLKTVDARDDMAKFQVLGLPKESDWVLYAPYPDKTLMRDVLAYDLSNQIGRWAPRTRFVELFLNESGGRVSRRITWASTCSKRKSRAERTA